MASDRPIGKHRLAVLLGSAAQELRLQEGRGCFLLGWVLRAGSVTGGATVGVKE